MDEASASPEERRVLSDPEKSELEAELDRLRESGLFTQVVATDSHPRAAALAPASQGFLAVESIAGLLADCVERLLGRGSGELQG